jgi:hypothetical protein
VYALLRTHVSRSVRPSRVSKTAISLVAVMLVGFAGTLAANADELVPDKRKVEKTAKQEKSPPAAPKAVLTRAPTYQARLKRNVRTAETPQQLWRYDFLERVLEQAETKTAERPLRVLSVASRQRPQQRDQALSADAAKPIASPLASMPKPQSTSLGAIAPKAATNPIVTSALGVPAQPGVPLPNTPTTLQGEDLVMSAERAQAAQDLVKLELSLRTYEELRQSGQPSFESRPDWRILERAQDALTGAELSAAQAVGFEANAYINETQKTIVIGIAGTKDLRRHLIAADIWQALIKAEQPQHFFMAKSYARSVITRYQLHGFHTECVGHSLGGGACAYLAGELGIRALVVNPITAGKPAPGARFLVTNYVVDGDIANLVYGARGNEFGGEIQWVSNGRSVARAKIIERYGPLSGPILVVNDLRSSLDSHKLTRALDLIAQHAGVPRIK